MRALRLGVSITLALFLVACGSDDDGDGGGMDVADKFGTLDEMLSNPTVQQLIAQLPGTDDIGAGQYYSGSNPADISGQYRADDVNYGETGTFVGVDPSLVRFGGTIGFDVTGPGEVTVLSSGDLFDCNGAGSFIVGEGNRVTVFSQLFCECQGEMSRQVSVDRLIFTGAEPGEGLVDYARNATAIVVEPGGICQLPNMLTLTDEPAFFEYSG